MRHIRERVRMLLYLDIPIFSLYATYAVQSSHFSFLHLRHTGAAMPDARTLEASLEAASAAWCRFGILGMKTFR